MYDYLTSDKPNVDADSEHCKACGGRCCSKMSGATYPNDFKKPLHDSLVKAFKSGEWSIDWWEGEESLHYVRPRHLKVKWEKSLLDPSWGGVCVFLTESGCRLPADKRPAECRSLHWIKPKKCKAEHNKETAAIAWKRFQKVIFAAAKEVKGDHL
jgi:Fe-S-cluster containining protein